MQRCVGLSWCYGDVKLSFFNRQMASEGSFSEATSANPCRRLDAQAVTHANLRSRGLKVFFI